MKKTISGGLAVCVLALCSLFFGISPGAAHTPSASASCEGVVVSGSDYGSEATLNAAVDGVAVSKNFTGSDSITAPVPQDGAVHNWTASVTSTHGENSESYSGTVGPCGTPPPTDACPDIPGDQPEGTDCTPDEPPVDNPPTDTDTPNDNPYTPSDDQLPNTGAESWMVPAGIIAILIAGIGISIVVKTRKTTV